MKAISLHMPWALFIMNGWKTIETRCHDRFKKLQGSVIAIHAAQKVDKDIFLGKRLLATYIKKGIGFIDEQNQIQRAYSLRGKVICTALIRHARWAPNIEFVEHKEWNEKAMCEVAGKFCLFLDDIKPLKTRIPYRGQQGIFNVSTELINANY